MNKVRAKKHLGQHFLKDQGIADRIATSLTGHGGYQHVLEVGPGMGVLTGPLLSAGQHQLQVIEVDRESVAYLNEHFPTLRGHIIEGDFLNYNLHTLPEPLAVIGNFPYNISSQIFFRVLEFRQRIPEVVGMLQKEVAERLASPPGKKTYGILSVLLQAFYEVEYLFSVPPEVFQPPPKVNSGVIRLKRNNVERLDCDEKLFFRVVKQGFNMRRKTLRNALKSLPLTDELRAWEMLDKRAEQLTVADFVQLTNRVAECL